MISIKKFVFNPFQVNTYVLYDETNKCIIIDPGCYEENEKRELVDYIDTNNFKVIRIINTHVHTDHILGNAFVCKHFGMGWEAHPDGKELWGLVREFGSVLNLNVEEIGLPESTFEDGAVIKFGDSELEVVYTPGHAAGSVCFISHEQKFVISGDVLFRDSIGRTDLPTGDYKLLNKSIQNKLFTLDDDYEVYSGHGPETTIGHEKLNNPFVGLQ
jgi:glyoxylase-like metal-dependent hydrolase (beta-lactamase superfamily II)